MNDILDKNFNNSQIAHHFRNTDMNKLKQVVFEFFSMGTGGPHTYTGRDMRSSHESLGISESDFSIGNDDVLKALQENGVAKAEIDEVIGILDSLKGDVLGK